MASARFDFNDFMQQFERISNMGGLKMLKLMPGFSSVSEKQLYEVEKKVGGVGSVGCEQVARLRGGEGAGGGAGGPAVPRGLAAGLQAAVAHGRCTLRVATRPRVTPPPAPPLPPPQFKMYNSLIASMTNEVRRPARGRRHAGRLLGVSPPPPALLRSQ